MQGLPNLVRDACIHEPRIVWTLIVADLTVWLSYMVIPACLVRVLWARGWRLPLGPVFCLFAAFIFPCGLTHLVGALVFFRPWFVLEAVVLVCTAVVSLFTAVILWFSVPSIILLAAEHERLQKVLSGAPAP